MHRLPARKSLGQNFIIDPNIVGRIIDEADIGPEDTVVEIGPGQGAMTRGLAERAKHLIAIELDERLLHRLKTELSDLKNIDLILGNALTFPYERLIGKVKVVANLPYYISSPMITRLIEVREKIDYLILMLQKEVAERITAPPGGKEYGYLSVMVQLWAGAEILFHVPREAFSPVPKVDSAVVRLRMRASPEVEAADYGFFGKIVG
ncbi:MAG: 16S rRNA (adenine(1518)-N(6)/adenine(1519)-N(6))-dimethyltransferase RsmA, partial [Nitrospirota bacterium]